MKRTLAAILSLTLLVPAFSLSAPRPAEAAYVPPAIKVAFVRSEVSQAWLDVFAPGCGALYKQDQLYAYLDSKGWDVTLIHDKDLENITTLRQYDVVVANWVFSMSTLASNTVVKYVGEGGGLVVPYASSRVAAWEVGPPIAEDSWVRIMKSNAWEWGPLSEVNQTCFIDDVGAFRFKTNPVVSDPIVTTAKGILEARGKSTAVMDLYRDQGVGAWIEYVKPLVGNTNTKSFLTLTQLSAPTGSTNYSIANKPGAIRSTYLSGRSAYFYFSPTDFVINQEGNGTRNGVDQAAIAGAYIEAAMIWAAGSGGRPGVLVRDGRTHATVNVYGDGIYASNYVSNAGNVQVTGTLYFRVYDPSGRLVKQSTRWKIGPEPGEVARYSESYVTRGLSPGSYRVEVEYLTTYPKYERRWVESVNVVARQGVGIPTVPNSKTFGRRVYDPRVVRVAGADRYATSLAIADAAGGYPRPGGYVIIAGGGGADALLASSLAGVYDAPLVLTAAGALPAGTRAWLQNSARGFDKAIIVGGTGVVSSAVESDLKSMFGDLDVNRIAGSSRYATSVAVADEVVEQLGDAYDGGMIVTFGSALADAAGASAIANGRKWPIVFVERGVIPTETAAMISRITSDAPAPKAWIAGGTGVVYTAVEEELKGLGLVVNRAAGANRYETAVKVTDLATATGSSWTLTGMASGVRLADALCLGSYVGRSNGVMLLTNGSMLTVPTTNRITAAKSGISTVAVAGGTAVVSHDLCGTVSRLLP